MQNEGLGILIILITCWFADCHENFIESNIEKLLKKRFNFKFNWSWYF